MSLFLNLYLGHLLGDFLFQPGRLVLAKRNGIAGLLVHTLIVGAATVAVCFATIGVDWPSIALVTGMHLVVERLTIATYLKTPTRGLFTLLFDQTLHLLSMAVVVWVAGDWAFDAHAVTFGLRLPTAALAAVDGLLAVMLFGSILVFETGNALLRLDDGKGRVLRLDIGRVGGMVERGAALAVAIWWTPLGGLLVFAPHLAWAATRKRGERMRPATEAVAGALVCAATYVAVATIAYLTGTGATPFVTAGQLVWP